LLSSSKTYWKDAGEAKKRKMTNRRRKYQTRPWLAEERRRHYARLMEELRVHSPSSAISYV